MANYKINIRKTKPHPILYIVLAILSIIPLCVFLLKCCGDAIKRREEQEYSLLAEDFGEYMANGFCAYKDSCDYVYFPSGEIVCVEDEPGRSAYCDILSVSKDRIIFKTTKFDGLGRRTLFVSSSWDLLDKKIILDLGYFECNYTYFSQDGTFRFGEADGEEYHSFYKINFFKGEAVQEEISSPMKSKELPKEDYHGKLKKEDNNILFSYDDYYSFSYDLIDPTIKEKMDKWHFIPHSWYIDYQGQIYVTFKRSVEGQRGIIIMQYNKNLNVFDKYQVALTTAYFNNDRILPIYDSFADEMVLQ